MGPPQEIFNPEMKTRSRSFIRKWGLPQLAGNSRFQNLNARIPINSHRPAGGFLNLKMQNISAGGYSVFEDDLFGSPLSSLFAVNKRFNRKSGVCDSWPLPGFYLQIV